jgi:hypothetical protein
MAGAVGGSGWPRRLAASRRFASSSSQARISARRRSLVRGPTSTAFGNPGSRVIIQALERDILKKSASSRPSRMNSGGAGSAALDSLDKSAVSACASASFSLR